MTPEDLSPDEYRAIIDELLSRINVNISCCLEEFIGKDLHKRAAEAVDGPGCLDL